MGARKRGRPKSNGVKPFTVLFRELVVLYKHRELRESGMKRSSAIRETIDFMRKEHPEIKISETGVKRILAKHERPNSRDAIIVTKKPQDQVNREFGVLHPEIQEFLGGKPPINVMPFRFGSSPKYRRSNARSKNNDRKNR